LRWSVALILVAGLVLDGGLTLAARERALDKAQQAARAGAQAINLATYRQTSLGNWVRAYRKEHAGDEPPLQVSERARLRELERENRELRMKNDFLSKAAAYFAAEHR